MKTGGRAGLLTRNLMDRSKLEAGLRKAGWEVVPLKDRYLPEALEGVLVDLEHPLAFAVIEAAAAADSVHCVAYGPHVRVEALEQARRMGATEALPRSVVFRDVASLGARLA
ncbi:MAG: hypothetical protein OXS29_04955 [bacterium]|nr:hypothetical protein [bacterium]MDE0288581.1 hypothetical protein [bacterium]MDE0437730.1 hypothetical protein [bacterium]